MREKFNMKQWKKYLAAAGTVFIILALFIIVNNNRSKDELPINKNSVNVNENIQTGDDNSNNKENNILSAAEEDSSEMDTAINEKQSVSEDDIKSEIDKLINTYYETPGETDEDILTTQEQTGENQTTENQTTEKQTTKKQTTEKQTAGKQTAENQTAENQTAENQSPESSDKKSEIIEEYKNIKTYIKPGLEPDSYVVFSTYDIKLYNIDTLVPGMSSLSVVRDETGILRINNDSDDAKLNDYIIQLAEEKDIKKIIKEVNTKLTAAMKKDSSLKELIDYLK